MKTKTLMLAALILLSIAGGIAWAADGDIPAPPDVAAVPQDAEVTESGFASKVIQEGTGTEHPTVDSTVTVHYTGWMANGEMFDSSVMRGETIEFPLDRAGRHSGRQQQWCGRHRQIGSRSRFVRIR